MSRAICLIILSLASSASAQEYLYPNKLHSESGRIDYRPYTLEEARSLEQGRDSDLSYNPFLTDWGQERLLVEDSDYVSSVDLASSGDSLYCVYATINHPRIGFTRSTDGGLSWSDSTDLSDTSLVLFNRFPDIICRGSDLVMGFRGQEPGRGENLFFRRSADAGTSWGPMGRVFPYWTDDGTNYGSLSSSGQTLFFAYRASPPDSLYVVRSTDWGTTWNGRGRNVASLGTTLQPMRIAASGSFVHLVWVNMQRPVSVRYSRSTDRGLSWSPEVDIAEDTMGAQVPYISVDGPRVAICWMGYKYSPYMFTGDLFVRQSFDNGATWDTAHVLTDLHYVRQGTIYLKDSLTVAPWEDFRFEGNNDEEMARISTDLGESWGDEQRLSFGEGHSYPAVAASSGSVIHALWGDLRPEAPGLYYCRNDLLTGIDEDNGGGILPEEKALLFAYPNPFNSSVVISYRNISDYPEELVIYNILGEKVRMIELSGKEGKAVWDGKDSRGMPVSSGVYFARIAGEQSGNASKLVLLR